MLNLIKDGKKIKDILEGGQFTLPNGDLVSPAYEGWEKDGYTLIKVLFETSDTPSKESLRTSRQAAYAQEADPIFFMAQRDEATIDEWKAKVAEIKTRFPYPVE